MCPPPVLWRRRVAPPRKRARTRAFGGRAGRAPGRRGARAWLALLSSKNARGRPASCPRAAARRGAPPRRAAHGRRRRSALISPVACCDGRQRPPGARECVAPLVFREADWQRHFPPRVCRVWCLCLFSVPVRVCCLCPGSMPVDQEKLAKLQASVRLSLLKLARWLSAREGPSTHSEAENDRPGWTRLCAVRVMSGADGEMWATHARTHP